MKTKQVCLPPEFSPRWAFLGAGREATLVSYPLSTTHTQNHKSKSKNINKNNIREVKANFLIWNRQITQVDAKNLRCPSFPNCLELWKETAFARKELATEYNTKSKNIMWSDKCRFCTGSVLLRLALRRGSYRRKCGEQGGKNEWGTEFVLGVLGWSSTPWGLYIEVWGSILLLNFLLNRDAR